MVKLAEVVAPGETRDPRSSGKKEFTYVDIASVCNRTFSIVSPKFIAGTDAPSRARKVIKTGDVLYATTRPYLKSIASVTESLNNQICSTGFCVLRPTERILPEWLFYCATSDEVLSQITPLMRGATYPAVTDKDILGAVIPLPPLPEQRRIITRIKECMERVEEIERLRTETVSEQTALFPSVLNKSFTEVAASSPKLTLEEVCEIRGGGSLPKGTNKDSGKDSVLLVKVGDMNLPENERLMTSAREYLAAPQARNSVVQAGAIIFPKRGGAIATNKKRVRGRPSLIDPNLMAIEARQELISPGYLYYWSLTLDLRTISNGGVIPQLNRKDLAPLVIPVPDLASQNELVERFEMLETLCSQVRVEANLRDLDCSHLRDAILRKAFAGEL